MLLTLEVSRYQEFQIYSPIPDQNWDLFLVSFILIPLLVGTEAITFSSSYFQSS